MPKDDEPIDPIDPIDGEGKGEVPTLGPDRVGLVAWNNVVDTGTVSVAGGGVSLTPIENVQDRRLAKSWRYQTPGGGFTLVANLPAQESIRLVAVNVIAPLLSEISGDGLVSATLFDSLSAPIAEVYGQPISVQGEGKFFPSWLFFDFGEHHEEVASVQVAFIGGWHTGPGGIVDVGRMWSSYGLSLPGGFDAGWSQSVGTPDAKKKTSRGGQAYVRPALPQRTTSFAGTGIDVEDVILSGDPVWRPTAQQLGMQTASFEECIALIRTDTNANMQALGVYGSMAEGVSWQHQGADYYSVNFKHIEER